MTLTGKEQSGKYTDLIKLFISTMNITKKLQMDCKIYYTKEVNNFLLTKSYFKLLKICFRQNQ